MDFSKIRLSCSWEASKDLDHVLCISSSSGAILDQPSSFTDGDSPAILLKPTTASEACQLLVDEGGLAGYLLAGVELISGARTLEVYDEQDEYIGTARGTLAEDTSVGCKMFCCRFTLPNTEVHTRLHLKLLSLQGKAEVTLQKVQLILTEDHSGIRQQSDPPFPCSDASLLDSRHFLDSLSSQHHLPPMLQSFVASLQHLQATPPPSQPPASTAAANLPPDFSAILSTLRQMRPAPPPPAGEEETAPDLTLNGEPDQKPSPDVSDPSSSGDGLETSGASLGEDLSERERLILRVLEENVTRYIDSRFTELKIQMDKRFEEWTQKVQHNSCSFQNNDEETETHTLENGHSKD